MLLRLIFLCLSLTAMLPAWEFTYSGTTATDPFWTRPDESLTSVPFWAISRYDVQTFTVPTTTNYTITSTAAAWDNFIVLYQNGFNAAAPLTNAVLANDDFTGPGTSRIATTLVAGTTYHLVTTGFWLGASGNFTNTISDAPEPATWLMIAFGCGVLFMRRQLQAAVARPVMVQADSPQKRPQGGDGSRA
jgi:hypothetical protein